MAVGQDAFELNDFWWGQWYHLVSTHEVVDLVYEVAVRSFSVDHPLFAVMTRRTSSRAAHTFASHVSAINTLINVGGPSITILLGTGRLLGHTQRSFIGIRLHRGSQTTSLHTSQTAVSSTVNSGRNSRAFLSLTTTL
ncbi:hypothetical protein BT69DRAFT_1394695 [Atractiella rhizophila]|nr:hypothetical protein BT69DRAFT_1394695 [Atractiella rhizophila]